MQSNWVLTNEKTRILSSSDPYYNLHQTNTQTDLKFGITSYSDTFSPTDTATNPDLKYRNMVSKDIYTLEDQFVVVHGFKSKEFALAFVDAYFQNGLSG